MKLDKDTKDIILLIMICLSVGFFGIGLLEGYMDRCKYESIASRINIPYIVGCELARPRFN